MASDSEYAKDKAEMELAAAKLPVGFGQDETIHAIKAVAWALLAINASLVELVDKMPEPPA